MKKAIKYTLMIIISCLIIFLTNGFVEKCYVNGQINDFMERGEFVDSVKNRYSGITYNYYKVVAKHDYEINQIESFTYDYKDSNQYVGSKTDIILTTRNPMKDVPFLSFFTGFFSENFYAGHGTINTNEEGSMMIEVVGNDDNNGVRRWPNDWLLADDGSPRITAVRIKNTTEEQRQKMVEFCEDKLGLKYNYFFVFDFYNSYYCTDLLSRAGKYAGLNLNYDYLATTGNDIILSKDTYIFFHREKINEMCFNMYYLTKE